MLFTFLHTQNRIFGYLNKEFWMVQFYGLHRDCSRKNKYIYATIESIMKDNLKDKARLSVDDDQH